MGNDGGLRQAAVEMALRADGLMWSYSTW